MRVCVLAQASPSSWVEFYVRAFREVCDTITVGPTPTAEILASWDRKKLTQQVVPNDITCDFSADVELLSILPTGWVPDLVVGIAGMGGAPLYQGVARLPCPTAFITIDTWQCLLDYREARQYDFVFVAQREFVDYLRETGSRHVSWLPLACDPTTHHPESEDATHDVSFVGSVSASVHERRRQLIQSLATHYSVLAQEAYFEEAMRQICARGRLVFNESAVQELNMRIFEVMGMKRPLVTNTEADYNGLSDLFEDGKHLIVYDSEAQLIEKVGYYLEHSDEREAIAEAGYAEVMEKHTYAHRVATLLETVIIELAKIEPSDTALEGDRLCNYLPTVPRTVVDIGLGIGASKVGLRKRGVKKLIGITQEPDAKKRRGRSYDEIFLWPGEGLREVDVVVVTSPESLSEPMAKLLSRVHAMLCPGGTLVMRLTDAVLEEFGCPKDPGHIQSWLQEHRFHLRILSSKPQDGTLILQARKQTRLLREIVDEVLSRLQVPQIDIEDLLGRIPPGM